MQVTVESYRFSQFTYQRRRDLGLLAAEVARKAGITQTTLSRVENCQNSLCFKTVTGILRALNTSLLEYAIWEEDYIRNQEASQEAM